MIEGLHRITKIEKTDILRKAPHPMTIKQWKQKQTNSNSHDK